jgi:hypothetical protein
MKSRFNCSPLLGPGAAAARARAGARSGGNAAADATPVHIPQEPWVSVSIDFVTGLPKSKGGYDAILVVVDQLTKMVRLSVIVTPV